MSEFESFLVAVVVLFGFFASIRIQHVLFEQKLFSKSTCQSFVLFYFCILIFVTLVFGLSPAKALSIVVLELLLIELVAKLKTKKQINDFYLLEIRFIRGIHLKVSSGRSVVDALSGQISTIDDKFSEFREVLCELVSFQQQNLPKLSNSRQNLLIVWIAELVSNPVNSRDKLSGLENKLQIEHDFRRRSGQALLSTKIQAVVMVFIYFVAAAFMMFNYDFQKNLKYYGLSIILFLVGLFWTLNLGKTIKWKV